MSLLLSALLSLLACQGTTPEDQQPRCDGEKQPDEEYVDAPFDKDGDGYPDADDETCRQRFSSTELDCADDDPEVHPGKEEETCNGLDDDCRPATVDAPDADYDGFTVCENDCDDNNAARAPDFEDLCHDGIDQDCSGEADEGCPPLYTGRWPLDTAFEYSCLVGQLSVRVAGFVVTDDNPDISFDSYTDRPGLMEGTLVDDQDVDVWRILPGDCDEGFRVVGSFVDEDTFEGTLEVKFNGGLVCLGCESQLIDITARREVQ